MSILTDTSELPKKAAMQVQRCIWFYVRMLIFFILLSPSADLFCRVCARQLPMDAALKLLAEIARGVPATRRTPSETRRNGR
eukprot:6204124-Pleurochrysis_carterae.AAC.1